MRGKEKLCITCYISIYSFLSFLFPIWHAFIYFIHDEYYIRIPTKLLENNEKHFSPDEIVPRIRFPQKFPLCRSPLFFQKTFMISSFQNDDKDALYQYLYIHTQTVSYNLISISNLSKKTDSKPPNCNIIFSRPQF